MTTTVLYPGPADIRDVAAADWDQDGRTDIVAATGRGLSLFHYQRSRGQWLRSDLHDSDVNGGGYDLVAVMHTDRDGYPDAAAYNRYGKIDFLRNAQNNLRTDLSAQAAGMSVGVGANANALVIPLSTAGRLAESGGPADPNVVVTKCDLIFQQAVSGPNGTWTPGAVMNSTALLGVPIAPGVLIDHSLRLTISANPSPLSATRFFITVAEVNGHPTTGGPLPFGFGGAALLMNNHPVLYAIRRASTPLQVWREANFGAPDAVGDAANEADPDDDGVPNIMEYVTNSDPKSAAGARPLELSPSNGATSALLRLRLSGEYDGKVKLSIQSSTDLQTWTTMNTRTGTGAWSKEPTGTASAGSGKTQFTFSAAAGSSPTGKQFFRIAAEELPE
ncbi:MAG: VCBS repeat-containing protein [Verrucomicrobiaceae bacterium]|nr:MAG: VCBS repeat-containing protein [Verrucomicrobiaceae bacterium]